MRDKINFLENFNETFRTNKSTKEPTTDKGLADDGRRRRTDPPTPVPTGRPDGHSDPTRVPPPSRVGGYRRGATGTQETVVDTNRMF